MAEAEPLVLLPDSSAREPTDAPAKLWRVSFLVCVGILDWGLLVMCLLLSGTIDARFTLTKFENSVTVAFGLKMLLALPVFIQGVGIYAMYDARARLRYVRLDFVYDLVEMLYLAFLMQHVQNDGGNMMVWGINLLITVVDLLLIKGPDFVKAHQSADFKSQWPILSQLFLVFDWTEDFVGLTIDPLTEQEGPTNNVNWKDWVSVLAVFALMASGCSVLVVQSTHGSLQTSLKPSTPPTPQLATPTSSPTPMLTKPPVTESCQSGNPEPADVLRVPDGLKGVSAFWNRARKYHTYHFAPAWANERQLGIQYYAFETKHPDTEAVRAFWDPANNQHTFHFEPAWPGETRADTIVFYAYPQWAPNASEVKCFWDSVNHDMTFHLWPPWANETVCSAEQVNVHSPERGGYENGTVFWAFDHGSNCVTKRNVFRFWNEYSQHHTFHFAPAWTNEIQQRSQFAAYDNPTKDTLPLYELYNRTDHSYSLAFKDDQPNGTALTSERTTLYAFNSTDFTDKKKDAGSLVKIFGWYNTVTHDNTFHSEPAWPHEQKMDGPNGKEYYFYAYYPIRMRRQVNLRGESLIA